MSSCIRVYNVNVVTTPSDKIPLSRYRELAKLGQSFNSIARIENVNADHLKRYIKTVDVELFEEIKLNGIIRQYNAGRSL